MRSGWKAPPFCPRWIWMDLIAASQRDFESGRESGRLPDARFSLRLYAKQTAGRARRVPRLYAGKTMSDPKHPGDHPDGDIGKGAVEDETPHAHRDNPYIHGQLGHRTTDADIKENDTDFPGPDAKEEHSGEKGA